MAKFINKKEQVFDLKLTTYGHYLLSVGTFKPTYYAFYDDNVIYDNRYARIDSPATGSVTFTGLPTTNDTVTIASTDGTSKAYIAKAATDTTADPPEFANVTSKQLTAAALKTCIESENGHNGKILVNRDGGALTLTQRDKGAAGNNAITDDLDNATVTGFDGGRSGGDAGIIEPQNQNNVDKRVKDETQYLESLVLFKDVEETLNSDGGAMNSFDDVTSRMTNPGEDLYKFDRAIGDAFLDGPTNYAPAWKVVSLQSYISSSFEKDTINDTLVPQLNISASYILRVVEDEFIFDPQDVRELNNRTIAFSDNRVIELESMDPLYYIEELNTELLTKNFEIEVFHKLDSSTSGKDNLQRKYFQREIPQVQNGFLMSETKDIIDITTLGTGSIEYYFDVLLDAQVEQRIACKGASIFNKQSYYVDIDFDCAQEKDQSLFYDIYGSVTEPEICLD